MKKVLLLLSALVLLVVTTSIGENRKDACTKKHNHAQVQDGQVPTHRTCGTMEYMEQQMAADPNYAIRMQQIEEQTQKWIAAHPEAAYTDAGTITIPVVVHVVWKTASQNLSDARILEQIQVLNDDYRALNSDTNLIPGAFKPLKSDLGIEFCMAQRDPNGNPTNGIERRQTTVTTFTQDNKVKYTAQGGLDAWPNDKYMNIWVCPLGNSLLGYAQFPGGNPATDGVVILYSAFGKTGATPPYNKGRTTTHEFGHCFNLRHVWGDDGGACTGSDMVDDTPNQASEHYGCPTFPQVSCSNGPNGDMFMNYMDYVDDGCMQMFSKGQKLRVQALFVPGGARYALTTSNGCQGVNTSIPIAIFTADDVNPPVGGYVHYTDQSIQNPQHWAWSFPGGTPDTSNEQNPVVRYYTNGVFDATLKVWNDSGSDIKTKVGYITVGGGTAAWIKQNSGFTTASRGIDQIWIVDKDTVWAKGYDGANPSNYIREFTKTTNGGTTWTPGTITFTGSSSYGVANICALNSKVAWACMFPKSGTGGAIVKTVNGGTTWTKQTTAPFTGSWANWVHFWDANNGVCMGDAAGTRFFIYTTTDGGTTWVQVPVANLPAATSGEAGTVNFYDVVGNTIWFGTSTGRVFKSTDKGYNWTVSTTGLGDVQTNVFFRDEMNGIATGTSQTVTFSAKRTTDGGATWIAYNPTGSFLENHIAPIKGSTGTWINVSADSDFPLGNGSSYSTDDGNSWTRIDSAIQYTSLKMKDIATGWAGSFNVSATDGGIFKWGNPFGGPVITPDFKADKAEICNNQDVVFTDYSSTLPTAFEWNFGEGAVPQTATTMGPHTVKYTTPGVKTVSLKITVDGTAYTETKTNLINVHTFPEMPVAEDVTVCENNALTLTATGQNLTWYNDTMAVVSNDATFATGLTLPGTYKFYISAKEWQCESEKDSVFGTIKPTPAAPVATGDTACFKNTITLNAVGTDIKWYANDTLVIYQGNQLVMNDTVLTPATYTVYATQTVDGCESVRDTIYYVVNPLPSKPIVTQNLDTLMSSKSNTYQWYNADGLTIITGATAQKFVPTASGNYFVEIANQFACTAKSDSYKFFRSAISDLNAISNTVVVPNPSKGSFELRYSVSEKTDVMVKIFNLQGQLVYTQNYAGVSGKLSAKIDLSREAKGVYNLQIITNGKVTNQKVLIE